MNNPGEGCGCLAEANAREDEAFKEGWGVGARCAQHRILDELWAECDKVQGASTSHYMRIRAKIQELKAEVGK